MDLFGIELGPNVPTVVFGAHLLIASFFFFVAGNGLLSGREALGAAINAAIGLMIAGLGVSVSRIAARQ